MRIAVTLIALLCQPGGLTAEVCADGPFHRPIAATRSDDGRFLYVANESGEVVTVGVDDRGIHASTKVGRTLADLLAIPASNRLLALDDTAHALLVLDADQNGNEITVTHRIPLPEYPRRVALSLDKSHCAVTCRWSSTVSLVDLTAVPPAISANVDLPFPPQEIVALPENRFLVADAFAGELAVIDMSGSVVARHSLHAHNIRGLVVDADGEHLLMTHQILSRIAQADFSDIFWGVLMQNVLRRVPLTALADDDIDLESEGRVFQLGDLRNGAADPGSIALTQSGFVMAISGTNEVAFEGQGPLFEGNDRVRVGVRPTRIATSKHDDLVFVVNTLSDSVSWLSSEDRTADRIGGYASDKSYPDALEELSAVARGERAFYSGALSNDSWMSCNSCHVDGHTPDLLADTLGDGTYGTPKKIPSLFGTVHSGPWAWDGSMQSVEEQVAKSLRSTMHGQSTPDTAAIDITAYLTSLTVPQLEVEGNPDQIEQGSRIFDRLNCSKCHYPDPGQSAAFDVGFTDEKWKRHFNAPALEGVRFRRAFLHDGRATSLQELFTTHAHPPGVNELTGDEIEALIAYISSL